LSVESLPYTLLLLLAQFSAGVAVLVLFVQLRGGFEAGFVRICSWLTVSGAFLTTLTALFIDASASADAYLLDADLLRPARAASLALLLFGLAHIIFLQRDDEPFLANATGATTAGLGAILLILLASLVRLPAWSVAGPLLTFFAGALSLGAFTVAMIWGHWYLVNPRLEEGPLNELTLIAIAAIGLELAITALNAIVPVGAPFESDALLAVALLTAACGSGDTDTAGADATKSKVPIAITIRVRSFFAYSLTRASSSSLRTMSGLLLHVPDHEDEPELRNGDH